MATTAIFTEPQKVIADNCSLSTNFDEILNTGTYLFHVANLNTGSTGRQKVGRSRYVLLY